MPADPAAMPSPNGPAPQVPHFRRDYRHCDRELLGQVRPPGWAPQRPLARLQHRAGGKEVRATVQAQLSQVTRHHSHALVSQGEQAPRPALRGESHGRVVLWHRHVHEEQVFAGAEGGQRLPCGPLLLHARDAVCDASGDHRTGHGALWSARGPHCGGRRLCVPPGAGAALRCLADTALPSPLQATSGCRR